MLGLVSRGWLDEGEQDPTEDAVFNKRMTVLEDESGCDRSGWRLGMIDGARREERLEHVEQILYYIQITVR